MAAESELAPLLASRRSISGAEGEPDRSIHERGRCCRSRGRAGRAVLCLTAVPGLLVVVVFAVYRCAVSVKMAEAWREAARLPPSDDDPWTAIRSGGGGAVAIDPLQGARPEFLFDAASGRFASAEEIAETAAAAAAAAGGEMTPPLAVVHGVEITARDMDREAELLARLLPGTYVQSIEYAPGAVTYFELLDEQLDALCLRLRRHRVFGTAKELDILGHSSGGVLARAVAQNVGGCFGRTDVRVRHYVGLAVPQQGVVAAIPDGPGEAMAKSRLLERLFVSVSRSWFAQSFVVATAAYLYDPRVSEDNVWTNFGPSSFLGRLNLGHLLPEDDRLRNLGGSAAASESARGNMPVTSGNTLAGVDGVSGNVLLVASMQDEVVRPTESAFFSRAVGLEDWSDVFGPESGRNPRVLRAVCDTDVWRLDTIGIRRLWDEKRVFVHRSPTRHGPLLEEEYVQVIAPFLRGDITLPIEGALTETYYDRDQPHNAKVAVEKICGSQEVEMLVLGLDSP